MKSIEDLRDKYKGKEIWVIGCGPSLDDFPEDFFIGKMFIAMRLCDIIFPDFTFSISSFNTPGTFLGSRTDPARLKREIFTLNPIHKRNWLGEYNKFPIFLRTLKPYSFADSKMWPKLGPYVSRIHVEETIKHIMNKESCQYAGIGIMQGWAIEAALVLGASKVTLAGCEGKVTKFKFHASRLSFHHTSRRKNKRFLPSKDGFSETQLELFSEVCRRIRTEAQWFAEILKPYGIEISRYFYKTGYERIIPQE